MKDNKKTGIFLLLLLLLLSVGYGLISTNLNINGTSKIAATTWDIHFGNVRTTSNSNVIANVAPSAPLDDKVVLLTYDVNLVNPGDVYEFKVDVINDGTIDAMIELFTSTIKIGDGTEQVISDSTIPDYLTYYVKYDDGSNIDVNRAINAKSSKTIVVHVGLKDDVSLEELQLLEGTTISLKVGMSYKQKDSNAID